MKRGDGKISEGEKEGHSIYSFIPTPGNFTHLTENEGPSKNLINNRIGRKQTEKQTTGRLDNEDNEKTKKDDKRKLVIYRPQTGCNKKKEKKRIGKKKI